jgi:RNA polymerase sigma-70 factor (ECF subfamily)
VSRQRGWDAGESSADRSDRAQEYLWDEEIVALFQAHSRRLAGYVRNLGAPADMAEDIVQDSFLATRHRWRDVREFDNPVAYLYKVATNRMLRLCRAPVTELRGDLAAELGHVAAAPDGSGALADVNATLGMLPRRQHHVILLRYIYGFSVCETAGILKISEGAVKNYSFLGRRRFRELLALDFGTGAGEGQ